MSLLIRTFCVFPLGCKMTISNSNGIPFFMKSQNDFFQDSFLFDDSGKNIVQTSNCDVKFAVREAEYWQNGLWEYFSADQFQIVRNGLQYSLRVSHKTKHVFRVNMKMPLFHHKIITLLSFSFLFSVERFQRCI